MQALRYRRHLAYQSFACVRCLLVEFPLWEKGRVLPKLYLTQHFPTSHHSVSSSPGFLVMTEQKQQIPTFKLVLGAALVLPRVFLVVLT